MTRLGDFSLIGPLLEDNCDFFENVKCEVAQRNSDSLGNFLNENIYYIFTKIGSFKTMFVVVILRFQKWFDVSVLDF